MNTAHPRERSSERSGSCALLSAPYTYFVTTGSPWMSAVKAVLGPAAPRRLLRDQPRQFGQFASRRSTFYLVSSIATVLVVLVALVAVNYIAVKKDKSWDLTTQEDLHPRAADPQHPRLRSRRRCASTPSSPRATPTTSRWTGCCSATASRRPTGSSSVQGSARKAPDLAQKYQLREGQTTLVLTRGEGDKETHTTVSVTNGVTEQDLTNALIKLNSVGEQKVYFTTGHGEWPLEPSPSRAGPRVAQRAPKTLLQEGYPPSAINLADGKEVPKDAALVVIAGARRASSARARRSSSASTSIRAGGCSTSPRPAAEPGLDALLARTAWRSTRAWWPTTSTPTTAPTSSSPHFFGDTELARE